MFDVVQKNSPLMELNAFSSSTSKTITVLFVANMSCIECTMASHLASYPTHGCKFLTAFVALSLTILMTTFPAVLQRTSPKLIGCKSGFLSRTTNLLAMFQVMLDCSETQFC